MKTKVALVSGLISVLGLTAVQAQNVKDPCTCESDSRISVITENDYQNFLDISALKKYSNVIYNGLYEDTDRIYEYRLAGNGKDTSINALYGKDGKLITARLVKKNTPLPNIINRYLVSDDFKDWTMVSNKTFVKDFDAISTEYEVKLKKGKEKRTLYFDSAGNPITRLAIN